MPPPNPGWTRVWVGVDLVRARVYRAKTPKSNQILDILGQNTEIQPCRFFAFALLTHCIVGIQELDLFLVIRPLSRLSVFQNLNASENEKSKNMIQVCTEVPQIFRCIYNKPHNVVQHPKTQIVFGYSPTFPT